MGTLIAGGQHLRDVQAGEAAGEEAEEDGVREATLQVGAARAKNNQQGTKSHEVAGFLLTVQRIHYQSLSQPEAVTYIVQGDHSEWYKPPVHWD